MARHDLSELANFLGEQQARLLELHEQLKSDLSSRAEIGIEAQVEMVGQFMAKHFPTKQQLSSQEWLDNNVTQQLQVLANDLLTHCKEHSNLYAKKDLRGSRCLKLLEELAELMQAESLCDEVEAMDALVDMDYLLKGTAWVQDLPLAEAFTEVHRSNMSKAQLQDALPAEKREKGPDYKKPDLLAILLAHRKELFSPHRITWDAEKKRPKCELCDIQLSSMFRDIRKYGRSKCFGRPTL